MAQVVHASFSHTHMHLHCFVQWYTWTYTSFLPLYLNSCHVLLKPLCLAQKEDSVLPQGAGEEDSHSFAAWFPCQVLASPTAPVPVLVCWLPAQCQQGTRARSQGHGRMGQLAESCWLETKRRSFATGLWEEERGSGTAQGQASTHCGFGWVSHGFAAFVGEGIELMCASGRVSWIWSDLHCNNQKNLLALCLGSGFIIARAVSQQATSWPPKSTPSLGRRDPPVSPPTFSQRPAEEHFWGSLTGTFHIQQNCCMQGNFLAWGETEPVCP